MLSPAPFTVDSAGLLKPLTGQQLFRGNPGVDAVIRMVAFRFQHTVDANVSIMLQEANINIQCSRVQYSRRNR